MILPSTLAFLEELRANNNKEWFDAHRSTYEREVKKPFRALVHQLIEKVCAVDSALYCTPDQAVFRINRDVRFSKDKTPYKTNLAAAIGPGGRKGSPSFYIHIESDTLLLGGGAYAPSPEQIADIRWYLMRHPDALPEAVRDTRFASMYGAILGEKNKVMPPDFRDSAATVPYLCNKQWYFMREGSTMELLRADDQSAFLFDAFVATRSVNSVLHKALLNEM